MATSKSNKNKKNKKRKPRTEKQKRLHEIKTVEKKYRRNLNRIDDDLFIIDRLLAYRGKPKAESDGTIVLEHKDSIEYIPVPYGCGINPWADKDVLRVKRERLEVLRKCAVSMLETCRKLREDIETPKKNTDESGDVTAPHP